MVSDATDGTGPTTYTSVELVLDDKFVTRELVRKSGWAVEAPVDVVDVVNAHVAMRQASRPPTASTAVDQCCALHHSFKLPPLRRIVCRSLTDTVRIGIVDIVRSNTEENVQHLPSTACLRVTTCCTVDH